jgi:pimeloyl-ACP methyl ester carboxylesterase
VDLSVSDAERREVVEARRGEPWFPEAFAALERIWSGQASETDWTAVDPFTHGRWDAVSRALEAANPRNPQMSALFYAEGAFDPEEVRAGLARLATPVLLIAGEQDAILPPTSAVAFGDFFGQCDTSVLTGGGHYPWLDSPQWFVDTVMGFAP